MEKLIEKMEKNPIPKAVAEKILKKEGAKRVSEDAKEAFAGVLMKEASIIGERAVQISKHSGRKTINDSDIQLAVKNW